MIYCLDANIFIEAKNLYYHFNICPGFWECLDQQNGTIGSVLPVFDELLAMVIDKDDNNSSTQ